MTATEKTYTVRYPHAAGHTASVVVTATTKSSAVAAARAEVGSRWSLAGHRVVAPVSVKVTP